MGRSRERERFFAKQQAEREKRAAYMQGYSANEIDVGRVVGEYPCRDYAQERADLARKSNDKGK